MTPPTLLLTLRVVPVTPAHLAQFASCSPTAGWTAGTLKRCNRDFGLHSVSIRAQFVTFYDVL